LAILGVFTSIALLVLMSVVFLGGETELSSAHQTASRCSDYADFPVTVDAVVVQSRSDALPVGTTKRAMWSVNCGYHGDVTVDGSWPEDLDEVKVAPARAARPIDCSDGERRSLMEVVPSSAQHRVFAPGTSSIGWFVTNLRGDGCDLDDGVRWEFAADVDSEQGLRGKPSYIAAGSISAQVTPPTPGTTPRAMQLTWDECIDSCSAQLTLTPMQAEPGTSSLTVSELRGISMLEYLDPADAETTVVLEQDCIASDALAMHQRGKVTIRSADGRPLQEATDLTITLPPGALDNLLLDWQCTDAEAAIGVGGGTEVLAATVTGRTGSGEVPTPTTAPSVPDLNVDIAVTGNNDVTLDTDVELSPSQRRAALDRQAFATQYALSEWGPFVVFGVMCMLLAMARNRRQAGLPRRAEADDPVDLIRESCELAAQASREGRHGYHRGRRLGYAIALVGIPTAGLLAVLAKEVDNRWWETALFRLAMLSLAAWMIQYTVLLLRDWRTRRRIKRRVADCRRLLTAANTWVDPDQVAAVVVSTIDALPIDTIELSLRSASRTLSVEDDFDAARTTAVELTELLIPDHARGHRDLPPDIEPQTSAARDYLNHANEAGSTRLAAIRRLTRTAGATGADTAPAPPSSLRNGPPPDPPGVIALATTPELMPFTKTIVGLSVPSVALALLVFGGDSGVRIRVRFVAFIATGLILPTVIFFYSLWRTTRAPAQQVVLRRGATTQKHDWYRIETGTGTNGWIGIHQQASLPSELTCWMRNGPGVSYQTLSRYHRVIVGPARTHPPAHAIWLEHLDGEHD